MARGVLAAVSMIAIRRLDDVALAPLLAAAVAFVVAPLAGVAFVAAVPLVRLRRRRTDRLADTGGADSDVVLLSELTVLGLGAGLGFRAALRLAAREVHPELRREVFSVIREATRFGGQATLEAAGGRATDLYRAAGRASLTGAPLLEIVAALVVEQRAEERARAVAAAKRLPVRMLFPLALLILPGFLVLTVGPTLLSAFDRLAL
jgi:tight adherence protein C